MTRAEALPALAALVPGWTPARVEGFLLEAPDEQAMTIQTLKDAGAMPAASGWEVFMGIVKGCVEIAEVVIPLTGAIAGVYGVGKL